MRSQFFDHASPPLWPVTTRTNSHTTVTQINAHMHDIFRDDFFTASTHSALTSTITHKTSVYPAFWLPPISTCVTVSPVYLLGVLEKQAPFTIRISSTLVGYNSRAPSSQPTVIIRHRSGLQTERPVTEARRETRLRATRRIEITQTVFTEMHYFGRTVVISGFPEPGVAPRHCHSKLWALRSGGFTRIRWALRPIQRARPPFACFVARGPSRVWLRHGSPPRSPRRPSG